MSNKLHSKHINFEKSFRKELYFYSLEKIIIYLNFISLIKIKQKHKKINSSLSTKVFPLEKLELLFFKLCIFHLISNSNKKNLKRKTINESDFAVKLNFWCIFILLRCFEARLIW
jgi:hypothetical protein